MLPFNFWRWYWNSNLIFYFPKILDVNETSATYDGIVKKEFDYRRYNDKNYNYTLSTTDHKVLGLITVIKFIKFI